MGCNSRQSSDGTNRVHHDPTHLFTLLASQSIASCLVGGCWGSPFQMRGRLMDGFVGGLHPPVICNRGSPSDRGVGDSTGYI